LWYLSFCNLKTCNQLTSAVLDNVIFPPERPVMENHGYPDPLRYSSATWERGCM